MKSAVSRFARMFMLALTLAFAGWQPAAAQQDSEPQVLRDTETEAMFRDMSLPLIKAGGLDPASVKVVLLNDPEINAFVAQGQTVYVQSGLLEAVDNVNQLQGVVAHELGHVIAGDSIRSGEGEKQAMGVTILSLLLGVAAVAAGAGDAGMGIMMAGQRAAVGGLMAFTRGQEATADATGSRLLSKAGISGKGMLDFFGKLQNEEYRLAIYDKDSFDRDHPLNSERVEALSQKLKSDPAYGKPIDPKLEAEFERVKAKLLGYINPKQAVLRYPETDKSVPAHYARAYAYHLGGYPEKAEAEADALLAVDPHDPYFLELKGQILLEDGKPKEAVPTLREATERSDNAPMIASLLGHALVATDDPKNFEEAKQILKVAVDRDNEDPFAWYQLGIIYDHEGDQPRAFLATAERSNLEGNPKMALANAQMAMKGIPPGSPDYLRAQDIAMVSKAELAKKDKKYRNDKE
ncbi:MAG TPA: M48 family metalloprotease [Sphingomicrobium sp.]|jgi:predicted Zn-dependent protease|nr:M48 family metalloprotease [Sphingomicrobium sp.]